MLERICAVERISCPTMRCCAAGVTKVQAIGRPYGQKWDTVVAISPTNLADIDRLRYCSLDSVPQCPHYVYEVYRYISMPAHHQPYIWADGARVANSSVG